MDLWLFILVGAVVGGTIAFLVFLFVIGKWYVGNLREDRSFGEGDPYYFMEIANGALGQVKKNRFVLLRVRRENYIQEDRK